MNRRIQFEDIMTVCGLAYNLGRKDYHNGRRVSREFQGALPKRKIGSRKLVMCLRNEGFYKLLSGPVIRMMMASYDQGLLDRHEEIENEIEARTQAEEMIPIGADYVTRG